MASSPSASANVIQALDGIRDAIQGAAAKPQYLFPRIETGPFEEVLGFSTREKIVLVNPPPASGSYFSSTGVIVDVWGKEVSGTRVSTSFPLDPTKLATLFEWPPPQDEPYNKVPPDVVETNTAPAGYSRQAYFWNNDQDSIVTVGPAVPKIVTPLVNGSGQFWVAAVGVISQGTGKYKGVRGEQAYVGSAYFDPWPPTLEELFEVLAAGFTVHSASWIKLVLGKAQDQAAPKSLKAASPEKKSKLAGAAPEYPTASAGPAPTSPEAAPAVAPEPSTATVAPATASPEPAPTGEGETAATPLPAETPSPQEPKKSPQEPKKG